jgi:glucose 1-dehydrogenase
LKPLKNQKAMVTGAISGIGEACALALGAAGAAVVVNLLSDAEEANRIVEAICRRGSDAIALQADVSREDQVQAMFNEMKKHSARSTS